MRMLPLLAASAALVVAFAGAATAQQRTPVDNGDPSQCTALCPPVRAGSPDKYDTCGDKLDNLRRVTVGEVRAVGPHDTVRLVPLCDTANRTLTEAQAQQLARGNIQGLLPSIAGNAAMADRLAKGGYRIDDVLGIAMGPEIALLYVSRR